MKRVFLIIAVMALMISFTNEATIITEQNLQVEEGGDIYCTTCTQGAGVSTCAQFCLELNGTWSGPWACKCPVIE